jgi:hypothetical protein
MIETSNGRNGVLSKVNELLVEPQPQLDPIKRTAGAALTDLDAAEKRAQPLATIANPRRRRSNPPLATVANCRPIDIFCLDASPASRIHLLLWFCE